MIFRERSLAFQFFSNFGNFVLKGNLEFPFPDNLLDQSKSEHQAEINRSDIKYQVGKSSFQRMENGFRKNHDLCEQTTVVDCSQKT